MFGRTGLFRKLIRRRLVLAGLVMLVLLIGLALGAEWLMPYDPGRFNLRARLQPPSGIHVFGTDDYGRDVLSRVIYGARYSLSIGALVMLVASALGILIGLLAGFYRRLDAPLMRFIDAQMAFPDILLAIALVAAIGASFTNVVIALAVVYMPRMARVVRASTLVIREMPYIEAARALGVSTSRIILAHVLLNLTSPVIVQATFVFAYAILAEAGLSFLGLGVPPDVPTWGIMIAEGQGYIRQADWMILFPGLAIVAAVCSLQLVGDGMRDVLDPRLRRTI